MFSFACSCTIIFRRKLGFSCQAWAFICVPSCTALHSGHNIISFIPLYHLWSATAVLQKASIQRFSIVLRLPSVLESEQGLCSYVNYGFINKSTGNNLFVIKFTFIINNRGNFVIRLFLEAWVWDFTDIFHPFWPFGDYNGGSQNVILLCH